MKEDDFLFELSSRRQPNRRCQDDFGLGHSLQDHGDHHLEVVLVILDQVFRVVDDDQGLFQ